MNARMQTPDRREATPPWHALPAARALELADATLAGLSGEEATQRLAAHGPNVLPRQGGDGPLLLLWRQINSPLVWVLLGSAGLAIGLGKVTDGAVVLAVVVLNTLIGFVQEFRAGRAIEALSSMVPEQAMVLRDGRQQTVPVAELVPGDLVMLASGDRVPADGRLVAVKNLQVEEAALTGESVPVQKTLAPVAGDAALGDRTPMVFGGTLVTYGTGTAVVVATGQRSELGRISTLLKEAASLATPLTRALATIASYITIGILVLTAVIFAVGAVRLIGQGIPLFDALREMAIFAIALAVGAIPEGLPAIVTIALAIGVQRMAGRRAIIRKLPAAETLGSTSVICSDKTGTLTRNEMTAVAVWTPSGAVEIGGVGYAPQGAFRRGAETLAAPPAAVAELLRAAALCSDASLHQADGAWHIAGDPTEAALVVAAEKAGLDVEALRREWPRRDAIPFESENQFMATLHDRPGGGAQLLAKGAPEVLARRAVGIDEALLLAEVERLATAGMRVLAVAARDWSAPHGEVQLADVIDLRLLGLVGMIDPPRPEAIEAVQRCHAAGITVKMITGDHAATARAIGQQLGLVTDQKALSGRDLEDLDDDGMRAAAASTNVFARVAPEHKLRLVKALQADGHIVAMTGDGVNDAPALKQSNIGIAMGITGSAVSKEAADIVLADDNFASIAAAVEEGRRVYDNLIKSLAFVLPTNLGLAGILMCAVFFFPFDAVTGQLLLPMAPTQLLWINLVGAVTLALPLAFEAREPDTMRRPPRDPQAPVLSRFVIVRTVVAAALMTAGAIGVFLWEHAREIAAGAAPQLALREAQTMAVCTVIAFQIFYLLNCRSLRDSLLNIGLFSNPAVFVGIGSLLLLQALFVYAPFMQAVFGTAPLGVRDLLVAVAAGAVILPVIAIEKRLGAPH